MSLFGNLLREVTKTVSNVGEALVNEAADVTEVVTGRNRVTQTVRDTGVGLLQGAKTLTDSVVNMGEQVLGVEASQGTQTSDKQDENEGETGHHQP